MKFCFITDPHFRKSRPRYRNEEFYSQIMKKWHETIDIMENEEVNYFLNGGDLFDSCSPDLDVIYDVIDKWPADIEWLQAIGNHDLDSRSRNLRGTALGLLSRCRIIKILEKDKIIKDGNKSVLIRFGHYYDRQDGNRRFEITGNYDYSILILHDTFTTEKVKFKHTMVKEIGETDFDLVLCGHYHYPFNEIYGKTNYINPGSFTRLTKSKRDMNRDIEILLISPFEKKKLKFVKLESSIKFQEAFDIEKVKEDLEEESKLSSEFTDGINKLTNSGINLEEELSLTATEFNIDNDILETCKEYLSKARNA